MNQSQKSYWGIIGLDVAFFIPGVALGLVINDIPLLSFDRSVSISSLGTLFVMGGLIPLFWGPFTTNKRVIKDYIIEEAKDCIKYLDSIKDSVDKLVESGTTEKRDQKKINLMMSTKLGLKIGSLQQQIKTSFGKKSDDTCKCINNCHYDYWNRTTGGEMMSDSFTFDDRFQRDHDKNYAKMVGDLKELICVVNRY